MELNKMTLLILVPGNIHSGVSGNSSIMATGVFSARELLRVTRPSIIMTQNGQLPVMPIRQMDSPSSYYNYSPQEQPQVIVGMQAPPQAMPNGQSALSPSGHPHKRLKRPNMSSISSADDEAESVGDENESMSNYYGKSSANLSGSSHSSSGWQGEHMDPGMAHSPVDIHSPHVIHANKDASSSSSSSSSRAFTLVTSSSTLSQHVPPHGPDHAEAPPTHSMAAGGSHHARPTDTGMQQPMAMSGHPSHSHHGNIKYQDHQGNETFSDFVSLGMLPPPPPPPSSNLARPVAILRTDGAQGINSSPTPQQQQASSAGSTNVNSSQVTTSPGTPPFSRAVMSSPFSVLTRPEHAFAHIHPQGHQVFTYPSISPVNAISGVISPTTLSLIASPVATPRTTPRSTPIPRWTTPFISLDENMDYNMLVNNFMHGVNNDEMLDHERFFHVVANNEGMDGQAGSSGHNAPPSGPSQSASAPPAAPSTPSASSSTPKPQQTQNPQT